MKKTMIFAHRGVSQFAPENTLPALELAIDLDCPGIEFDVHLTADGIPVIIHDETIDRTSDSFGFIKDLKIKELKSYDFGSWFSLKYENAKIPTLQEFLQMAKDKNYRGLINIELKNDEIEYEGLEQIVIDVVNSFNLMDNVIFSSFNHNSINLLNKYSPSSKVALLYSEGQKIDLDKLREIGAYSANLYYKDVTDDIIKNHSNIGIKTLCYTVNSQTRLQDFINMGISGIFTNNPTLGISLVLAREVGELMLKFDS